MYHRLSGIVLTLTLATRWDQAYSYANQEGDLNKLAIDVTRFSDETAKRELEDAGAMPTPCNLRRTMN